MIIISNFLAAVAQILNIFFNILWLLIVIRALISWVNPDPFNPIVQFLQKSTEPILYRVRKILPFSLKFGIDISPFIAILIIIFLQLFLVNTLRDLSVNLRISG